MNKVLSRLFSASASTSDVSHAQVEKLEDRVLLSAVDTGYESEQVAMEWQGQQVNAVKNSWIVSAEEDSYTHRWLDKLSNTYENKKIWGTGSGYVSVSHLYDANYQVVTEKDLSAKQIKRFFGTFSGFNFYEPNQIIKMAFTPNDTHFSTQWGLHNTGQNGGTNDVDIDAIEAWDAHQGDDQVIVAVLDTGINYNHNDLANNMWINLAEANGTAGVDDDGNGFVDDEYGYDFAGSNALDPFNNDGNPMDYHSHGTHVAGIIGAEGNNSRGISGVNPNVRLMALKVFDDFGNGTVAEIGAALDYMNMMKEDYNLNIKVANMSLGWGSSDLLSTEISESNSQDILVVTAAGNGGADYIGDNVDVSPYYPGSNTSTNIINVASTDSDDQLASSSNFGITGVDLAAPGVDIYSTVLGANGYGYKSGTSMAAPHVAGALSLLLSYNPTLTGQEAKQLLLDTVDEIPSLNGLVATGGRLNVHSLLQAGNEAPEFDVTKSNRGLVSENYVGVVSTEFLATDVNSDSLTYSIVGGADQSFFSIDANTGVLSLDTALDYDNPSDANTNNVYVVKIAASDGVNTTNKTIYVDVFRNNAPVFDSSKSNRGSVSEGYTGIVDTEYVFTDAEGDDLTYSINGGIDKNFFSIDASTGVLSLDTALDYDNPSDDNGNNVYVVRLGVSDGVNTTNKTIYVDVFRNNAPVFDSSKSNRGSVSEGYTGVVDTEYVVTDSEGDSLTYSIVGGADQSFFSIDANTGVLSLDTALDYDNPSDANTNNVYVVKIAASDGVNTTNKTIYVDVFRNNAPVFDSSKSNRGSVSEGYTGVVDTEYVVTDSEGDSLTYSIVGGADQSFFSIDANTGVLSLDTALDYDNPSDVNTNNVYVVKIAASDGVNTTNKTIYVDVFRNNAPIFDSSKSNRGSVSEGYTGIVDTEYVFTDAEGDDLTYSINGGIDKDFFSIDASTGVLSLDTALDYDNPSDDNGNNVYVVRLGVSDGVNTTNKTIYVDVFRNNAPELDSNLTNRGSVSENYTGPVTSNYGFVDPEGDTLTYNLINAGDSQYFSINSSTGILTLLSALDYENPVDSNTNNVYRLKFEVSDGVNVITKWIYVDVINVAD